MIPVSEDDNRRHSLGWTKLMMDAAAADVLPSTIVLLLAAYWYCCCTLLFRVEAAVVVSTVWAFRVWWSFDGGSSFVGCDAMVSKNGSEESHSLPHCALGLILDSEDCAY